VKAVVYERYGSPDVLRIEDVPLPSPAAGQVRVKVAATSVNLSDWEGLRGSPAYARIGGMRSPSRRTLGSDIAGVVDDLGQGVTRFRTGDEVYGDNLALMGGFAEYAIAPESALAHKPTQLTFAEASTIPQAGAIALRGTERVVAGSRVLINGAGGGSGSFAIQLAKRRGAHVTGVDNSAKQDFMRSVRALLRVLTVGSVVGRVTGRSIGVLVVKEGPAHFEPLADLCVAGDIRTHIDRSFALDEVPAALARVGEGRALGKVVVVPS
jgi:NADPH:quinone reductase-like Zn-dependent oxidoreductase